MGWEHHRKDGESQEYWLGKLPKLDVVGSIPIARSIASPKGNELGLGRGGKRLGVRARQISGLTGQSALAQATM